MGYMWQIMSRGALKWSIAAVGGKWKYTTACEATMTTGESFEWSFIEPRLRVQLGEFQSILLRTLVTMPITIIHCWSPHSNGSFCLPFYCVRIYRVKLNAKLLGQFGSLDVCSCAVVVLKHSLNWHVEVVLDGWRRRDWPGLASGVVCCGDDSQHGFY